MAKDKKEKKEKKDVPEAEVAETEEGSGISYEVLASRVSKIAQPLAGKKLTKSIYKVCTFFGWVV